MKKVLSPIRDVPLLCAGSFNVKGASLNSTLRGTTNRTFSLGFSLCAADNNSTSMQCDYIIGDQLKFGVTCVPARVVWWVGWVILVLQRRMNHVRLHPWPDWGIRPGRSCACSAPVCLLNGNEPSRWHLQTCTLQCSDLTRDTLQLLFGVWRFRVSYWTVTCKGFQFTAYMLCTPGLSRFD